MRLDWEITGEAKERGELYKYNEYSVTTYDTVTGGIVND